MFSTYIYPFPLSCMCSHVWLFAIPWAVAIQAPLFMGLSQQEYWSGLPFPSPGDLPHPVIKPLSPVAPCIAGRFFTHWIIGKAPSLSPVLVKYISLHKEWDINVVMRSNIIEARIIKNKQKKKLKSCGCLNMLHCCLHSEIYLNSKCCFLIKW